MAEELQIEIAPDGKVTVRTKGIKGPACMDLADIFVQLLGTEDVRTKTSEYYESQTAAKRSVQQKQQRS
ncbi:MAG: DUF2997 domain-containing protein [Planctomycetes bacterium]|nr:DUF2997 domain-containing protein [Planctomycetota bacterium]